MFRFTLNCNGRLLVADKPLVMGIINVTPDSFYEGSRFQDVNAMLKQAEKMLSEGADILDIGAQSTRPGSRQIGIEEELSRLVSGIESLRDHFPEAVLSVDTYYAEVARHAVAAGAGMVNDISGGSFDPNMIRTVGELNTPYICMHVKGGPATMHQSPVYDNLIREILDYFIEKAALCTQAGIRDLIIDPGFGFSKTIAHNFRLLNDLALLGMLEKPILTGISRKSTIYKTLGVTAGEALNGTTVLNTICLLNGANILRVHDVKEAVETVKLVNEVRSSPEQVGSLESGVGRRWGG